MIKMYCIFAKESIDKINGVRGKMATQAGHAYLHSYWDAEQGYKGPYWDQFAPHTDETREMSRQYENAGKKRQQAINYKASDKAYKITLVVDTVEELKQLQQRYENVCGTALITDAGYTVFKEPTTTCLGLGPISEEDIGEDIKSIKTLT